MWEILEQAALVQESSESVETSIGTVTAEHFRPDHVRYQVVVTVHTDALVINHILTYDHHDDAFDVTTRSCRGRD